MVTVEEAEKIILHTSRSFGTEHLPFEDALGRVLAEDLHADRDLPPYNRVMMDGIAIQYDAFEKGVRTFRVAAVQAAGDKPVDISAAEDCVEIMTGAVLPTVTDTIIRYEDIRMEKGMAFIEIETIVRGQHVHYQGMDRKQDDVVVSANQLVTPAVISMAASVGAGMLRVNKLPRIIILSSGDELVDVEDKPEPFQIRRSNSYAVKSALRHFGISALLKHIPDDQAVIAKELEEAINNFDVIVISGGVSMGKFDYIPEALDNLGVEKMVYKVKQKPGKPFWFGKHAKGTLVFAFPGNPVSTFLCLHRYLLPWLNKSLGIKSPGVFAVLNEDVKFNAPMQYFLPVKLSSNAAGQLIADPLDNNGSGDFSSLVGAGAFLELPLEKNNFNKGDVYLAWPFKMTDLF